MRNGKHSILSNNINLTPNNNNQDKINNKKKTQITKVNKSSKAFSIF